MMKKEKNLKNFSGYFIMIKNNKISNLELRVASPDDAVRIVEIFSYYVKNTAITFYNDAPTVEEYKKKIEKILMAYPFYVASIDGTIMAYAYAEKLRPHDAYNWDVELSIYTDINSNSKGIGTILYTKLLETLKLQGIRNAYGVITYPNPKSEALHKKLGFEKVGFFPNCGNKFGEWKDVIWYSKVLNEFNQNPEKPIYFSELEK